MSRGLLLHLFRNKSGTDLLLGVYLSNYYIVGVHTIYVPKFTKLFKLKSYKSIFYFLVFGIFFIVKYQCYDYWVSLHHAFKVKSIHLSMAISYGSELTNTQCTIVYWSSSLTPAGSGNRTANITVKSTEFLLPPPAQLSRTLDWWA